MSKSVELFVTRGIISTHYQEKGCEHTATGQVDLHRPSSKLQFRKTRRLVEKDQEALKIVSRVAKERGWKVKVYDVGTLRGRLKARLRGVSKTPTIIIDSRRLTGIPEERELLCC